MDKFITRIPGPSKRKGEEETSSPKKSKNEQKEEIPDSKQEIADIPTSKPQMNHPTPTFGSVKEALDVPDLPTIEEFEAHFVKMADFIMNQCLLMVNGKKHRIAELEMYFTCDRHPDPFTHKSEVQKTSSRWYFHRTGAQYRTGNYKGLDISIGKANAVGGILIRSIESIKDSKFVCGPCKSVDHILETCSASDIPDLVDNQMKEDLSVESSDEKTKPLYLLHDPASLPKKRVYRSPRVGLHMTKAKPLAEEQKQFVFRFYRYFTEPKKIFKGRDLMTLAMHLQGKKPHEIEALTGSKTAKVLGLMDEGRSMKPESFMSKLADADIPRAFGAIVNAGYLK